MKITRRMAWLVLCPAVIITVTGMACCDSGVNWQNLPNTSAVGQTTSRTGGNDGATTHGAWKYHTIPFGINHMPRYGKSQDTRVVEELGLDFIVQTIRWIEPTKGRYQWIDAGNHVVEPKHLSELKNQGFKVSITYTNVHMDQKHLPPDLKAKRFNDPQLLNRWEKHLLAFLSRYGDYVDFVNIGNEVNNYFSQHRNEWRDYLSFVERGVRVIKRSHPRIKVGVILTDTDRAAYWQDLKAICDYMAITYYAPGSIFKKSPTAYCLDKTHPSFFRKTLNQALNTAAPLPLLITELGCATHEALDSSLEIQAQFIEQFFDWVRDKQDRILGISWLSLTDWPYESTKAHLKGTMAPALLEHEPFMRFLTSLGLQYEDGRPKPGYTALKRVLADYRVDTKAIASAKVQETQLDHPVQATTGVTVGFDKTAQLFTAPSHARVSLTKKGPTAGIQSMAWSFDYSQQQWQWCSRDLHRGSLKDSKSIRFEVRSDRSGPIWVRLEENGGKTFFIIVNVTKQWQIIERALIDFSIDPAHKADGLMTPSKIQKIVLADSAATGGATGRRTLWFSRWHFE